MPTQWNCRLSGVSVVALRLLFVMHLCRRTLVCSFFCHVLACCLISALPMLNPSVSRVRLSRTFSALPLYATSHQGTSHFMSAHARSQSHVTPLFIFTCVSLFPSPHFLVAIDLRALSTDIAFARARLYFICAVSLFHLSPAFCRCKRFPCQ